MKENASCCPMKKKKFGVVLSNEKKFFMNVFENDEISSVSSLLRKKLMLMRCSNVCGGSEMPALRDGSEVPALRDGSEVPALRDGSEVPALRDGSEVPALRGQAQLRGPHFNQCCSMSPFQCCSDESISMLL
jgi:hypothetical protein